MKVLSALLAFHLGNPPVTSRLLQQEANNFDDIFVFSLSNLFNKQLSSE